MSMSEYIYPLGHVRLVGLQQGGPCVMGLSQHLE